MPEHPENKSNLPQDIFDEVLRKLERAHVKWDHPAAELAISAARYAYHMGWRNGYNNASGKDVA